MLTLCHNVNIMCTTLPEAYVRSQRTLENRRTVWSTPPPPPPPPVSVIYSVKVRALQQMYCLNASDFQQPSILIWLSDSPSSAAVV